MIYAIPADSQEIKDMVGKSFGRARYFLLHDSETNVNEWLLNSAKDKANGAGVQAAQMLIDKKVDAIVAPRCGENAGKLLNGAGIRCYRSIDKSIEKNIKAMTASELEYLSGFHAGLHAHDLS